MLRRRLHEAADISAARKMLAERTNHDDPDARVLVEGFERRPELIALRHRHDIVLRPVEDDVRALVRFLDLDEEAIQFGQAGVAEGVRCRHEPCPCVELEKSYSAGWRRPFGFIFPGHEQSPQQFTDGRLWNRFDKDKLARPLEAGEAGLSAELLEFGL